MRSVCAINTTLLLRTRVSQFIPTPIAVGLMLLVVMATSGAQAQVSRHAAPKRPIVSERQTGPTFKIPMMWDEALAEAHRNGKPVIIFDVDYVDSNSTKLRDSVLSDRDVQRFLLDNFDIGQNDFSVDPPVTVGFDSLRNLGLRLSGLEDRYRIVIRPTVILLRPDSTEMDRIALAQQLTPHAFIHRCQEILEGRNTLQSYVNTFWRDTTDLLVRLALIDHFEERSMYDSVIRHVRVLASLKTTPALEREARLRYAYLRLNIEGKAGALVEYLNSLTKSKEDSLQYLRSVNDIIEFYQHRKRADSVCAYYERIFAFTKARNPDVLNDYAWELATYTKHWDSALVLVNEALATNPDEPNYLDTRALVWVSLKQYDKAIADEARAALLADSADKSYFQNQEQGYRNQLKESLAPKPDLQPTDNEDPKAKKAALPNAKKKARRRH